jgi:hypothetical protein
MKVELHPEGSTPEDIERSTLPPVQEDTSGGEAAPDPVAAAPAAADEGTRDEPAAKDEGEKRSVHAARRDVYKKNKALRDQIDNAMTGGMPDGEEGTRDEHAAPAADAQPERRAAPADKVVLKVHGRQVEMTPAEVTAKAQEAVAAGDILSQAKQILAEVREARQANGRTDSAADHSAATPSSDPAPTKARDRMARIREVVDVLQTEDPDVGAERLASLLDEMGKQPSVDEIAAAIKQRDAQERAATEVRTRFSTAHPEIAADADFAATTARHTHKLALAQMASVPGMKREYLEAVAPSPEATYAYYRQLREHGVQLPDPDSVVDAAAGYVEKKFKIKEGAAPAAAPSTREARRDEKRQIVQPRRAQVVDRPGTPPPATQASKVDRMRAARGFNTLR